MKTVAMRHAIILSIIIFLVLFITHFPTLYALINTPSGYMFTGNNAWFDPWDLNVYVAAIKWGQQGHFLLKNLYTTQPLPPALMYPLYAGVGFMFRWVNPYVLFTITAAVVGCALCASIYILSRYFFAGSFLKRVVFLLLVSLGGGLSWLMSWNRIPDGWFTGFTYHSLFQRGHEGLGVLSYTVFFVLLWVCITKGFSVFKIALVLVGYIIALLSYPYMYVHFAVSYFFLYIFYPPIRNKKTFILIMTLLLVGAGQITWYYGHLQHSGFGSLVLQKLSSVNPFQLMLGYGLFFFTFLYALIFLRDKNLWIRYFLIWIVVGMLLSGIPVGIARFFLRGLYFPMAALAIFALDDVAQRYKIKKAFLFIAFISFSLLTSIYMFHMRLVNITYQNYWVYLPSEESQAIMFLRTQKNAQVLSKYLVGNHIPAWTGLSVYMGHMIQTPQAEEKTKKAKEFYSGTWNSNKARAFLRNNHITHVYYGIIEQSSGTHPLGKIAHYLFLKPIYQKGGVTIYRVT